MATTATQKVEYRAHTIAEHLATCSRTAQRPSWRQVYRVRYPTDGRFFPHEFVALVIWLFIQQIEEENDVGDQLHSIASERWFRFGMPTWWATPGVVEMIKDTDCRGDRLYAEELPDEAGLIMLPRGSMSLFDQELQQDVEIVAASFTHFKSGYEHEGVMLVFHTSLGLIYTSFHRCGEYLDERVRDEDFADKATLSTMSRLAVRLLQLIHDAKSTIKESTQLSPIKVKHGEVKPALWSRRIIGEHFCYSRKPHQGGSHRPPRLHRRRAHARGVWVGARSSDGRHLEERKISATWVADSSLSPAERAQLIAFLGSSFESKSTVSAW